MKGKLFKVISRASAVSYEQSTLRLSARIVCIIENSSHQQ